MMIYVVTITIRNLINWPWNDTTLQTGISDCNARHYSPFSDAKSIIKEYLTSGATVNSKLYVKKAD